MKKIILIGSFLFSVCSAHASALSNRQLSFTRNDGQIDTHGKTDCRFYTSIGGGNYFFCADGITIDLHSREPLKAPASTMSEARGFNDNPHEAGASRELVKGHALKLNFVDRTNFAAEVIGEDEQGNKNNYFLGNNSEKWNTNVPNYSRVRYNDVWKGIDVVYYDANVARLVKSRNESRDLTSRATLEYDIILHPGADPNQIRFAYEGDDGITVNEDGALVIKTSLGDVIEQKPYAYQIIGGVKKEIQSSFIILHSTFIIQVGSYDQTQELVIDPVVYSTLLGGSGREDAWAFEGIAVDGNGNVYVTGTTNSTNFPTTIGAYSTTYKGGNSDAFVTKMNPTMSSIIYSTYLGGSDKDRGFSIAVDRDGNAYVTGQTTSQNFPPTPLAFQPFYSGGLADAFVTKLSPNGDALVYSTYLGGNNGETGYGIAIDASGNAYIGGTTQSSNFPVSTTAFDRNWTGPFQTLNGYLAKLSPDGSALVFGTYFGGPGATEVRGVAVDENNNAYITGFTSTTNGDPCPVTATAFDTSFNGGYDAYVAKFNLDGSNLVYSTYLGGAASEIAYAIAVDNSPEGSSHAYVTGFTSSSDYPTAPGNSVYQSMFGGSQDVFITKLNTDGTGLIYSTYVGDSLAEAGNAIAVDKNGNALVTGSTSSPKFPVTTDAFDTSYNGGTDAFVLKMNPSGTTLEYSTFVGGSAADIAKAIALDKNGNAYIDGYTSSSDFPTTYGAYDTTFNGGVDLFITKIEFSTSSGVAEHTFESHNTILGQNYPNPCSQSSVVSYQLSEGKRGIFEVRDMLGRVMYHTSVSSSTQLTIDAGSLPNGLYLYSLSDGKNIQSRMMMVSK